MRIVCPCCGERSLDEFVYGGDAHMRRPAPFTVNEIEKFHDYVYLRTNPAGAHQELWYHSAGCHLWLVVTRDTVTHAISSVQRARDVALSAMYASRGDA